MNEKYISRDNLELVISGLKTAMTADWDENDKNGFGYIENKPFRTEYGVIVDNYSGKGNRPICNFVAGNTYDVIWNGVTYKGLACRTDGEYNFIGGDGYPFYIDDDGGNGFNVEPESGYTVSILGDIVHKLDEKYIPDSIARANDVADIMDGVVRSVNSSVAGKMETQNPDGFGSFSMNRKRGTYVGKYSVATGLNTTASGAYSHAEGYYTTASESSSHAEGYYTTASGNGSHAEGNGTMASGAYSHAEGNGTTSCRSYQHVQGKYNILDTEGYSFAIGKYAHIVGNGTSDTERSNAHTLDWNGIGWYQGGIQVGGNAQDDGARNVLLEGDAVPVPETAEVGQLLAVKTVDENGKPSEWESLDMPGSFVVRDTEPDDTSVLWVDPTDNSTEEFPESSGGGIAVTGATVGQTVKISAVDENGVPTAWESVDFPSGWGEEATGVLELIVDHTVTAEEAAATGFTFTKDKYPLIDGQKVLFARVVKPTGLDGWWKVSAGDTMIISGSSSTNPIQVGFAAVVHGLWLFDQANGANKVGSFNLSPALNGYLGAYAAINAKPYAYYDSLMVYSHTTAFPEGTTIEIYGA